MYDTINIILNKGTAINISWQEFIAANRFDNPKTVVKLSDYVMNQQNKLLGHVVRTDRLDPIRQPTITMVSRKMFPGNGFPETIFQAKEMGSNRAPIGQTKLCDFFVLLVFNIIIEF